MAAITEPRGRPGWSVPSQALALALLWPLSAVGGVNQWMGHSLSKQTNNQTPNLIERGSDN